MKKVIALLVLFFQISLFSQTLLSKVSLEDFALLIARNYKFSVVYDSSIDLKSSFYLQDNINLLSAFKIALESKDYKLIKKDKIYFVTKNKPLHSINFIRVNWLTSDILKHLKSSYNFSFFPEKHIILYDDLLSRFASFSLLIKALDVRPEQFKFKITIFNTNMSKLKQFGLNMSSNLSINHKNFNAFFNLLSFPSSASAVVSNTFNIYTYLKFLKQKNIVTIVNEPFLLAQSYKKSEFNIVKNVPYKTSSTSVNNNNSITSNTEIKYKNVGLKLSLLPIINNNFCNISLSLSLENIVSIVDNLLITDVKFLNSFFVIKKGQKVILSGLKNNQTTNKLFSLPIIENIPILNDIFKYSSKDVQSYNLSILIEAI